MKHQIVSGWVSLIEPLSTLKDLCSERNNTFHLGCSKLPTRNDGARLLDLFPHRQERKTGKTRRALNRLGASQPEVNSGMLFAVKFPCAHDCHMGPSGRLAAINLPGAEINHRLTIPSGSRVAATRSHSGSYIHNSGRAIRRAAPIGWRKNFENVSARQRIAEPN